MSKSYVNNQQQKKKFANKLIIFLVILSVFFAGIIIGFALNGNNTRQVVNNPPKNDEVYTIAKQFVKQTVKTSNVVFPDTGYQFNQKQDSTYTIKSYLESKDQNGQKTVTSFVITLQFFGGDALNQKRWKMVSLIKD
jgi:flagellar basal body-associated protein FliL